MAVTEQGLLAALASVCDPHTGKEHFIWGATAGMLRNFYRFLSA